jgi:hypothetical protein
MDVKAMFVRTGHLQHTLNQLLYEKYRAVHEYMVLWVSYITSGSPVVGVELSPSQVVPKGEEITTM